MNLKFYSSNIFKTLKETGNIHFQAIVLLVQDDHKLPFQYKINEALFMNFYFSLILLFFLVVLGLNSGPLYH